MSFSLTFAREKTRPESEYSTKNNRELLQRHERASHLRWADLGHIERGEHAADGGLALYCGETELLNDIPQCTNPYAADAPPQDEVVGTLRCCLQGRADAEHGCIAGFVRGPRYIHNA